ncbi:hypothetical protein F5890DRAFT_1536787 [Lentinula detonsa]|uniref:Uncharacterized protein n=1 Tax=Lentinula detonsa TaxID=2804962 RepID=A0AA38UP35_9AGAR|nr:hypothetical protein F5890DRAFT_1536787 [Lentinula detonsa]
MHFNLAYLITVLFAISVYTAPVTVSLLRVIDTRDCANLKLSRFPAAVLTVRAWTANGPSGKISPFPGIISKASYSVSKQIQIKRPKPLRDFCGLSVLLRRLRRVLFLFSSTHAHILLLSYQLVICFRASRRCFE